MNSDDNRCFVEQGNYIYLCKTQTYTIMIINDLPDNKDEQSNSGRHKQKSKAIDDMSNNKNTECNCGKHKDKQ